MHKVHKICNRMIKYQSKAVIRENIFLSYYHAYNINFHIFSFNITVNIVFSQLAIHYLNKRGKKTNLNVKHNYVELTNSYIEIY